VLVVLSPVVQIKRLDARRSLARRRLGKHRGTHVVTLIHRMETLAVVGVPLIRFMSLARADEVARALGTQPGTPIDLIVHVPDGVIVDGEQIAAAIRACTAPVTVVVPHYALGTTAPLLAAAQRVVLGAQARTGGEEQKTAAPPAVWAAAGATRTAEADAELLRRASALLDLYPQPPRRRPGLVFVPLPEAQRRKPAPRTAPSE
jgi:hypothetical protein